MTSATLLFLPSESRGYRWWRVAGDRVVARGEGLPDKGSEGELVAVPPADAVALHWASLPTRSPAQAAAAARLLVADASAAPVAELHVAVGRAVGQTAGGESPIGVVDAQQMRAWLAELAERGVNPDRLVPAPLLLPEPESGYLRGEVGGEPVVRGLTSGFADEALLTGLVIGDAPSHALAGEALEREVAAALAAPALDLRQGAFARRRRPALDAALLRHLGWLVAALLLATLMIDVARIVRFDTAADAMDAQSDAIARAALPAGEAVNDAGRQLDERLAGLRGPGLGFTRTAAIAFAAVRQVPGTELTALDWSATGELRLSVATGGQGQIVALRDAIRAAGLDATASTFTDLGGGRLTGELTVRRR